MASSLDGALLPPRVRSKRGFPPFLPSVCLALALAGIFLFSACSTIPTRHQAGPWNLAELSKVPGVTWGATTGLVQELYYEGESWQGKPTRVFAYLGRPAKP
jgi:hypothetical protein